VGLHAEPSAWRIGLCPKPLGEDSNSGEFHPELDADMLQGAGSSLYAKVFSISLLDSCLQAPPRRRPRVRPCALV
jgi:hypothetical protein